MSVKAGTNNDGMDIFYSRKWAELFAREMGGVAEVFRMEDGTMIAQYPFIKRRINDLDFAGALKQEFFDIVSPYGYGGIYLSEAAREDALFLRRFRNDFKKYCAKERIVSEFIRFHPLEQNQKAFEDLYAIKQVNKNSVINLGRTDDEIFKNIEKRHRYSIRLAEKSGVEIVLDNKFAYLPEFKSLYLSTNDRTQATKFYNFSGKFFQNLIQNFPDTVKLVVAKLEEKVVAASIFIFNPDHAYYFLSGANELALKVCANHLLLYKIALVANKEGKRFFNLGGGLKQGDALSIFKFGFSKLSVPFYVGTRIVDKEMYDSLAALSGADSKSDYFPLYRAPKKG